MAPRIWTKPLRELTEETTLGFEVIRFAEEMLHLHLMPWQKWLLVHLFELRPDGKLRFRTVVIEVARQNGKSLVAQVICLYRLLVDDTRLVLGTAQNLDVAREVWADAVQLLESSPDLDDVFRDVKTGNGKEQLLVKVNRQVRRWKVAAATRKGGRGMSVDTVLMDELREQETWAAWSAIKNTTMARDNGLVIGISNAGDASSVVLAERRKIGIAEVDEGTDNAIFEWSAPEDCDLDDVTAWAQANPALGYTMGLDALINARSDPEATFRTENLCQWVTAMVETYINTDEWRSLSDVASQIDPDSDVKIAVDVSADRKWSSVSVAGWRSDGRAHVETIACRENVFWVLPFLRTVCDALGINEVVLQARGCAASEMAQPLEREGFEVRALQGSELGFATGQFHDRVRDRSMRHISQPAMDVAIEGAVTKKLGEAQVWDRNASMTDISPLVAASWALYALANLPLVEDEQTSAYGQMGEWWRKPGGDPTITAAGEEADKWWL